MSTVPAVAAAGSGIISGKMLYRPKYVATQYLFPREITQNQTKIFTHICKQFAKPINFMMKVKDVKLVGNPVSSVASPSAPV